MELKPKTEPGFWPSSDDGDDEKFKNMSVQDLISELRIATRIKQFDRVEDVLVAREARLKGEVKKMAEILACEKLDRMKIEEELKKCEKQCEQGKRAEEMYEKLLAEVKRNGPRKEDAAIEELRAENRRLGDELELWKRKFVELDVRILRLQYDTQLLMNGGNAEGEYGADFGVLLEAKENKGNSGIHVHGQENGNNNAESNRSQRNEDINPNEDALGAPASGRLGQGTIIEIEDSDDDGVCTIKEELDIKEATSQFIRSSSEAAQQKNTPSVAEDVIGMSKRKFGSRDSSSQLVTNAFHVSSSSSSDSEESETVLRSCRGLSIYKRRKT